jgi:hypothetical protein
MNVEKVHRRSRQDEGLVCLNRSTAPGHKQPEKLELESRQTIDVRTLSTGLLRQLAAELQQHEARNRSPLTPRPAPYERPED